MAIRRLALQQSSNGVGPDAYQHRSLHLLDGQLLMRQPIRVWGDGEKSPDEAYEEALQRMSSDEKKRFFDHQREIARLYDGPGGP